MKKHLILVVSLLFSAVTVQADVISLTTGKAVGEKIKIALNALNQATLTWGNGETQTLQFDGYPMEIEVKDAALTLTTETALTRFYAPAAGLETLDLTKATALVQLIVSDNNLSSLSFTKNKEIKVVDLQNNRLKTLTFSGRSNPALEYLNCANNELTSLSLSAGSSSLLRVLICSGNKLSKTTSMSVVENLETVWMSGNAIEGNLQLDAAEGLRSLNVEDNKFEALTLASSTPRLEGLWVSGNQLQSLDFSEGVPELKTLSAADNRLTQIAWSTDDIKSMDYVNLSGNSLFFTSFPYVTTVQKMVLAPQNPFFFADTVNVNTKFGDETWLQFSNKKRLENSRKFAMYDARGNALVKGASGDYNYTTRGVFTFYTHQMDAYFIVTSPRYEGVELRSLPFCAFDPETGIEEIIVENAEAASVYDLQGRVVATGMDRLPAGIYIVKGKKVFVK